MPHLLILPKQFYELWTKHSNIACGGHSYSYRHMHIRVTEWIQVKETAAVWEASEEDWRVCSDDRPDSAGGSCWNQVWEQSCRVQLLGERLNLSEAGYGLRTGNRWAGTGPEVQGGGAVGRQSSRRYQQPGAEPSRSSRDAERVPSPWPTHQVSDNRLMWGCYLSVRYPSPMGSREDHYTLSLVGVSIKVVHLVPLVFFLLRQGFTM